MKTKDNVKYKQEWYQRNKYSKQIYCKKCGKLITNNAIWCKKCRLQWNVGLTKKTDSRIKSSWNTGLTKETDSRVKKLIMIGDKHPNFGKQRSKETKEKISKSQKGITWNERYGKEKADKKRKEISIKTSEAMKRPSVKENYFKSRVKINDKFSGTKPEIMVYNIMLKEKYNIEKQKYIKDVGIVDFYLPNYNCIIEVFGDYWHANPKKYKSNSVVAKNKIASDVWQKDNIKINIAKKLGYKVVVLWENEIKKNIDKCISKIEKMAA